MLPDDEVYVFHKNIKNYEMISNLNELIKENQMNE
jgi:hypothetical protein